MGREREPSMDLRSNVRRNPDSAYMRRRNILLISQLIATAALFAIGGYVLYKGKRDLEAARNAPRPLNPLTKCHDPKEFGSVESKEKVRYVPLIVHRVVSSEAGFGTYYDEYIRNGVDGLNQSFKDLNLVFYIEEVHDIVDEVLVDGYAGKEISIKQFKQKLNSTVEANAVDNHVNVFILPLIEWGTYGEAYGLLHPENTHNSIVLSYDNNNNHPGELFTHEMGHVFGLYHPHSFLYRGRSCNENGDGVCDTPSDPAPYDKDSNPVGCKVDDNCKLAECGDKDARPLVNNFMSYYKNCRNSFTPEQKRVMECNLAKSSPELVRDAKGKEHSSKNEVLVGCVDSVIDTIQGGVDAVLRKGGGTLKVCEGVYPERINIEGSKIAKWYKRDKYGTSITIEATPDESGGAQKVVVDGGKTREFVFASNDLKASRLSLTIRNITFRSGYTIDEMNEGEFRSFGLIDFKGKDLTLDGVKVNDSTVATIGRVISFVGDRLTIRGSLFDGNRFEDDGALIFAVTDADVQITNSSFHNNFSRGGQGCLFYFTNEALTDDDGGGLSDKVVTFTDVDYENNDLPFARFVNIVSESDVRVNDVKEPVSNGSCSSAESTCE